MKRILFVLLSLLIAYPCYSNKRWKFGVVGSYNKTWLLNPNIRSDPNVIPAASFGSAKGISVKLNVRDYKFNTVHFGYTYELLISDHIQLYKPGFSATFDYRKTSLFYIDIPILFRYTDDYIINCELGPQISILRLAYGDFIYDPYFKSTSNEDVDIKDYFLPYNISALARVSVDIRLKSNFIFTPGLRFAYSPLDIISLKGKEMSQYYQPFDDIHYRTTRTMSAGVFAILSYKI